MKSSQNAAHIERITVKLPISMSLRQSVLQWIMWLCYDLDGMCAIQCEQFHKLDEMNAMAAHCNTSHDFRKIHHQNKEGKFNCILDSYCHICDWKPHVLLHLCVWCYLARVAIIPNASAECNSLKFSFPFFFCVCWTIFGMFICLHLPS